MEQLDLARLPLPCRSTGAPESEEMPSEPAPLPIMVALDVMGQAPRPDPVTRSTALVTMTQLTPLVPVTLA